MKRKLGILLGLLIPICAIGQDKPTSMEERLKNCMAEIKMDNMSGSYVLDFLYDHIDDYASKGSNLKRKNAVSSGTYELEDGRKLDLPSLTLEYKQMSEYDILNRITKKLGLTYKFDGDQIVFYTKDGKKIIRKEGGVELERKSIKE